MTRKRIVLILDLLLLIVLVLLDQYTKYLAIMYLRGNEGVSLIAGVLELVYVENYGAAFGVLQNAGAFFVLIALVILGVILYALVRTPDEKRYGLFHVILTVLAAGALGNLIDRLNSTYVVDFIYVSLIRFPVFNVADIFVTCAAFALFVTMFTCYKDEPFSFLNPRKATAADDEAAADDGSAEEEEDAVETADDGSAEEEEVAAETTDDGSAEEDKETPA